MQADAFGLWWRWLVVVTVGVMAFGLAMVLLPGPTQWFFTWLIFSGARSNALFSLQATRYITFVYGVLGAVMVGWMASLLVVVLGPYRRGERAGWDALAASMGVWFVVDTTFSLASGFWENALFNGVFFVLFAVPLAASYRAFHPLDTQRGGAASLHHERV